MKPLMSLISALLLVGCANRDIGVLTYKQAVMRYGPPDKERVIDGCRVAVWKQGTSTSSFGNAYGSTMYADHTTEIKQMILTFDQNGILRSVRK